MQSREAQNKEAQSQGVQSTGPEHATPAAPVRSALANAQQVEMTAPVMDFVVKNGNLLQSAKTSGPPKIVITQPDAKQKTIVTAGRFTAHSPRRIVSMSCTGNLTPGSSAALRASRTGRQAAQPSMFSLPPKAAFRPSRRQAESTYVSGIQKAWAQRGTYTAADQMLVLNGSPRVADGGDHNRPNDEL